MILSNSVIMSVGECLLITYHCYIINVLFQFINLIKEISPGLTVCHRDQILKKKKSCQIIYKSEIYYTIMLAVNWVVLINVLIWIREWIIDSTTDHMY